MPEDVAVEAPIPDDIRVMSFEQALTALDEIVQRLESGRVDLDESIKFYTRGTLLKRHCEAKLKQASDQIEKIELGRDGVPVGTQPVDIG